MTYKREGRETLAQVGQFFKNTGGTIKKKYKDTDFKATASQVGSSVKSGA